MIRPQAEDRDRDADDAEIMAEINITPLTDVFLVLLIIFMVGASVAVQASAQQSAATEPQQQEGNRPPKERGLEVHPPQGTGDAITMRKDVVVSVLPSGEVVLDGEVVPEAELGARLAEAAQGKGSKRVVVRGDEAASYREIMDVITTARAAGLTDVALATRVE